MNDTKSRPIIINSYFIEIAQEGKSDFSIWRIKWNWFQVKQSKKMGWEAGVDFIIQEMTIPG